MNRDRMIEAIEKTEFWDVIVIGGGASGLGSAVEAASRGFKTLLLEQHDFAKATSSRSTKLVHGGVRYLEQGNVSLVLEALHERGLMHKNAPHLVQNREFVVPNYSWWKGPYYGVGLKVYDMLAGKLGFGKSKFLSKDETIARIPTLVQEHLHGGVVYHDGQFDDSRMAVNLALTAVDQGGTVVNYMQVKGLLKMNEIVSGVAAKDLESGKEYEIYGHVVVNATGIFNDTVRRMDNPEVEGIMVLAQGVHLVFDKEFMPGESAILVPQTEDGRILFIVPWHDKLVAGTTDVKVDKPTLEPRAKEEEIEFIIHHAQKYLTKEPTRADVRSVYAGIRPLVTEVGAAGGATSKLSREHQVVVSASGLVTLAGGKWTTYRRMGQDCIDRAAQVAGLEERPSITSDLRVHGWLKNIDTSDPLYFYGSDLVPLRKLVEDDGSLGEKLHERLPYIKAEIVWAIRHEMARSVEDVLARRTRALLLDARASEEAAPEVARLMAKEMGRDQKWQKEQVESYIKLAKGYYFQPAGKSRKKAA